MKKIICLFLMMACAAVANAYTLYWEPHWNSRASTVLFQTSNTGRGKTLILGDSNTEAFWWNTINGCMVVNAGFGGAGIHDIAVRSASIALNTQPKIVHIMLGTNDLKRTTDEPEWATLAADFQNILTAFKAYGTKIVVWPIPPFASNWGGADETNKRNYINGLLASIASNNGAYWDWWFPTQIQGADGYANPGALVSDGVHFSAATQSARFYRIDTWNQTIKANTGVDCAN